MKRPALGLGLAVVMVAAAAGSTAVPGMGNALEGIALAGVLAFALSIVVDLPGGGSVPVGSAVAVAYPALLGTVRSTLAIGLGLLVAGLVWVWRLGPGPARDRTIWVAAASGAAIGLQAAAAPVVTGLDMHGDVAVLVRVTAAGLGFFAVELGLRRWLTGRAPHAGAQLRPLWVGLQVDMALLCTAALLAVAGAQKGPIAALVAAVPLLVIRYSFGRYTAARQTYEQAVRALSIVPEVAGLAPLGHGERTTVYTAALTEAFQLDRPESERIVTAARLHHIGSIALDRPAVNRSSEDSSDVARVSDEILSETGFLDGVSELVATVRAAPPEAVDLPCAIVRVASTFDELTADDPDRAGVAAVELLARHAERVERTVAVTLVQLSDRDPGMVGRAWAQGHFLPEEHHVHHHEPAGAPSCA